MLRWRFKDSTGYRNDILRYFSIMCLILIAHRVHPRYPLVVAANRDEFHARPTASSHFWQVPGGTLAGRDLEAGGTWLGLNSRGGFAAITNISEQHKEGNWLSRGELVQQFLGGDTSATAFPPTVQGQRYRGFNLLLWDGKALTYTSNRGGLETLAPGVYGLANDRLNESRFKVQRGTDALTAAIDTAPEDDALFDALFSILSDPTPPATPERRRVAGMSEAMQQALGACFIVGDTYGTRASTAVLLNDVKATMIERVYAPSGMPAGVSQHSLSL